MTEALNSNGVFCVHHLINDLLLYFLCLYKLKKNHLNYSSLPYQMSGSNLYGCSVNCNRFFHLQTMFTSLPVCLLGRNFWLVYYLSSSLLLCFSSFLWRIYNQGNEIFTVYVYSLFVADFKKEKKSNGVFTPFCAYCFFCLWYSN